MSKLRQLTTRQLRKDGRPTGFSYPDGFQEELIEMSQSKGKQTIKISTLTVEYSPNVGGLSSPSLFDADEVSVNRMINAVRQLRKKDDIKPEDAPHTKKWKLTDNTFTFVTADDLDEVLDLADDAMDTIINT